MLSKVSKTVTDFEFSLLELLEDRTILMFTQNWVVIADPQVGELKRMIAFMPIETAKEYHKPPKILVNPIIYDHSKEFAEDWEGCLSLPGLTVNISRPKWIDVHAQDEYGNEFEERYHGLASRFIQHEINHLDGILISKYTT